MSTPFDVTIASKPVDVTIVPEKIPGPAVIAQEVVGTVFLLLKAWFVMLILGAATPIAPAYVTVLGVMFVIRLVWPGGDHWNYTSWWRRRSGK